MCSASGRRSPQGALPTCCMSTKNPATLCRWEQNSLGPNWPLLPPSRRVTLCASGYVRTGNAFSHSICTGMCLCGTGGNQSCTPSARPQLVLCPWLFCFRCFGYVITPWGIGALVHVLFLKRCNYFAGFVPTIHYVEHYAAGVISDCKKFTVHGVIGGLIVSK